MNKLHNTIKSFLKKYGIDKSDLTYLVAFSGGYDSMCLLDILRKITSNKIIAIHLNHNWRGEESDSEEINCKNFCTSKNIEFYCEKLSKDIPHTETAAREARYRFFENCGKKFNSKVIFTAHNKNDNTETLIYRICLGTGTSGLQGIAPNRDKFYRPLLEISREEIERYCAENNLKPNSDSSNFDTKYKRNFIRAKVLPLLSELNPNIIDTVNSLSDIATEENTIINEYINNILTKISDNEKINTKKFLNLSPQVQKRIIYTLFLKHNLDYDKKRILQIWEFIKENHTSKSGKTCSLAKDLWIFINDKNIEIIDKKTDNMPSFHITKEGKFENEGYIFELEKFTKPIIKFPKDSENTAYINLKNIPINFEIRTRQDGDIIKPFGLNGTQKLKKYLNSKKNTKPQKKFPTIFNPR